MHFPVKTTPHVAANFLGFVQLATIAILLRQF